MLTLSVSGNITGEAVVRYTTQGIPTLNFTIAHNRRYKNASGTTVEQVEYIRCTIWNRVDLEPLFYKGRGITAVGNFSTRKIVNKNWEEKTILNLQVTSFNVFGKNAPMLSTKEQRNTDDVKPAEMPAQTAQLDPGPEPAEYELPF